MKWTYKIGTAAAKPAASGTAIKPYTAAPLAANLVVHMIPTVSDAAAYTMPATVPTYDITFTNNAAIALPATLAKVDAPGYTKDTVTVPKIKGLTWTVKVGSAAAVPLVESATGTTTVFKPFTANPAASTTDVILTAVPATDFVLSDATKTKSPYTVSFKTALIPLALKNPVFVNKPGTSSDKLIVSKMTGGSWSIETKDDKGAKSTKVVADTDYKTAAGLPASTYSHPLPKGTVSVMVVAVASGEYSNVDAFKPTAQDWAYDLPEPTTVDVTKLSVVKVDNPGAAADHVAITGVKGVKWLIGTATTPAVVAPGAIKKIPLSAVGTSLNIVAVAADDYVLSAAKTFTFASTDFTALTEVTTTSNFASDSIILAPNKAIKRWMFKAAGAPAATLPTPVVVPVGVTDSEFAMPAGTLTAEPNPGYTLKAPAKSGAAAGTVTGTVTYTFTASTPAPATPTVSGATFGSGKFTITGTNLSAVTLVKVEVQGNPAAVYVQVAGSTPAANSSVSATAVVAPLLGAGSGTYTLTVGTGTEAAFVASAQGTQVVIP